MAKVADAVAAADEVAEEKGDTYHRLGISFFPLHFFRVARNSETCIIFVVKQVDKGCGG